MTPGSRAARPHSRHVLLATFAALVVLLVGHGVTAPPAAAHNALVKTVPANGATVQQVPAEVRLVFDQPALQLGTQVLITGPDGRVERGTPQLVDNDVRQPIAPNAPAGRYDVLWRVTSSDGHPVTGEFSFTARAAGGGPAAAATAPSTAAAEQGATSRSTNSGPPVVVGAIVLAVAILVIALVLAWRRRSPARGEPRVPEEPDRD